MNLYDRDFLTTANEFGQLVLYEQPSINFNFVSEYKTKIVGRYLPVQIVGVFLENNIVSKKHYRLDLCGTIIYFIPNDGFVQLNKCVKILLHPQPYTVFMYDDKNIRVPLSKDNFYILLSKP